MASMALGTSYRTLWLASTISNIGDGLMLTAMPLLAVTLTRDPVLVAGVQTAAMLPWLLFSPVAGAIVDRLDRRSLMGTVDLVRAVLVGVLGIAVLVDGVTIPLLYVMVFLLGTAETLFDNGAQALMPMLVAQGDLEKANSRLFGAQIVTNEFAGPPIGGFLFAFAAAAPFLIDAASFALAAMLVLSLQGSFRAPRPEGTERRGLASEIAEGLRWLRGDAIVRGMALALGVFNLGVNGAFAIMVLYALGPLGLNETGFGVLLGVAAVGAFLGTLLAAGVAKVLGRGPTLMVIALVSGIDLIVIGIAQDRYVTAAMLALNGFAGVVWNVITVSLRQTLIPAHLLGRVNSVYRMIGWGTIPLGALLGGFIARGLGLRAVFFVFGVAIIGMAFVLVRPLVPLVARASRAG